MGGIHLSSKLKRLMVVVIMVTTVVMAFAGPAFGADPKPVYQTPAVAPGDVGVSLNPLWLVLGAVLVPEMGVLAYDNLQLNELDIVGADGSEMAMPGLAFFASGLRREA